MILDFPASIGIAKNSHICIMRIKMTPNDVVIFRRVDREEFEDTCQNCPAFSGSAESGAGREKKTDVACILLDTALSSRISGVKKLICDVSDHFDGESPSCGAMQLATARQRSRGQIKRRAEEELYRGYA